MVYTIGSIPPNLSDCLLTCIWLIDWNMKFLVSLNIAICGSPIIAILCKEDNLVKFGEYFGVHPTV